MNGRTSLHFKSNDVPIIALEDDVNFVHVLIAKMIRHELQVGPAHQFHDFGEDKGFENWAKHSAVPYDTGQSQSATAGEKAGVEKMQFWCFDNPVDCVAVP